MVQTGYEFCIHILTTHLQWTYVWFKEYSLVDWAELVQTKFEDNQPSLWATRPPGIVEL